VWEKREKEKCRCCFNKSDISLKGGKKKIVSGAVRLAVHSSSDGRDVYVVKEKKVAFLSFSHEP